MSWAASEWKDGLPTRALQKIEDLEQQLDKLKRERQQKQCQMDSLEQSLEKQKRKMEEDRQNHMSMIKENKSLIDSCDELERKRLKLEHDLQTKDAHISCLDGQLNHTKQALDAETAKVGQLKVEVDKMQSANLALTSRTEKLSADCSRLTELSTHQRKQLDELKERLAASGAGSSQQDTTTSRHRADSRHLPAAPVAAAAAICSNTPSLYSFYPKLLILMGIIANE
jgi:centromere protein F